MPLCAYSISRRTSPAADGRAGLGLDLRDLSRPRRLQFILHLHRFDDDDALMRSDLIAGMNQQPNDPARHRRFNDLLPAGRASLCAAAPSASGDHRPRTKIALAAGLNSGLDRSLIQNASKGMALNDQAQDSRLNEPRVDLNRFAVERDRARSHSSAAFRERSRRRSLPSISIWIPAELPGGFSAALMIAAPPGGLTASMRTPVSSRASRAILARDAELAKYPGRDRRRFVIRWPGFRRWRALPLERILRQAGDRGSRCRGVLPRSPDR